MKAQSIPYASDGGRVARVPVRHITAAATLVSVLFATSLVTVRHDSIQVDAVTDSRRVVSTWPLSITTGGAVQPSALETRLNAMGLGWSRDWRRLNSYGRSLVGLRTSRGCGSSPPIYGSNWLPAFVNAASDDEVRAFIHVMQSGTEAQQRAAMHAAIDIAFRPPAKQAR